MARRTTLGGVARVGATRCVRTARARRGTWGVRHQGVQWDASTRRPARPDDPGSVPPVDGRASLPPYLGHHGCRAQVDRATRARGVHRLDGLVVLPEEVVAAHIVLFEPIERADRRWGIVRLLRLKTERDDGCATDLRDAAGHFTCVCKNHSRTSYLAAAALAAAAAAFSLIATDAFFSADVFQSPAACANRVLWFGFSPLASAAALSAARRPFRNVM